MLKDGFWVCIIKKNYNCFKLLKTTIHRILANGWTKSKRNKIGALNSFQRVRQTTQHFQSFFSASQYFRDTFQDRAIYSLQFPDNLVDQLDRSLPTVLYIHGYKDSVDTEGVSTVVNAYLQRGDHNILVLDWSKLCENDYFRRAVPNMFMVIDFYLSIIAVNFFLFKVNQSFGVYVARSFW